MSTTNETQLIKRAEVQRVTTLSCSAIYAQMAKGQFPRPVKLSPRSVAWSVEEVNAWINNKLQSSKSEV